MKRWAKMGLGAALIAPALAGCGGDSRTTPMPPVSQPRSVSSTLGDGLTATLAEDKSQISVGGTVTYTLTLANTTALPITYQPVIGGATPPGFPASLIVTDAQGHPAFPLGATTAVIFIGPSTTLAPGQSVSGTLSVGSNKDLGQYATAGQYSAKATFTVQTGSGSASQVTTLVGPLTVDVQ